MSPRAVADARRASGLVLALVLVVSQASAWLHAAAIAHVACLEHGEAVHRASVPAGVRARVPQDPGQPALRADLTVASGHDHCGNAALLRWRDVALTAPPALARPVGVSRSLTCDAVRDQTHGIAVYRLAPKTSPPRGSA